MARMRQMRPAGAGAPGAPGGEPPSNAPESSAQPH